MEYIDGEALETVRSKVCLHYPEQIVRSLGLEISKIKFKALNEYKVRHSNLKITFLGVKVLRKRHNDKIQVNSNVGNHDSKLMKAAMKGVGCIPPYCKSLCYETLSETFFYRYLTQLQTELRCFQLIKNGKTTENKDDTNCTDVSIISSVQSELKIAHVLNKDKNKMSTAFPYHIDHYQEIVNAKVCLLEDLLESVEGYIGMILEFGLHQLL